MFRHSFTQHTILEDVDAFRFTFVIKAINTLGSIFDSVGRSLGAKEQNRGL